MADGDGNDNGDEGSEGEQPKETGKQLRTKLEETLAKNANLEAKVLIHESGLSHLTEKQRQAAIRDVREDGKEVTADTLKAAAKELGFPETPVVEKAEGEGGGEGGEGEGGNAAEDALNSYDAIDRARRAAVPSDDPTSFEFRVKNAKSAAEVEALVRSEGHKVGIVHEHDID